jgi:hypothetical protein
MRKRLVAIYSVLVVAIVLLAAFVPSCTPTTGTIQVNATLCGVAWQGAVNYTLTPTGGSPINGTAVPTTHSSMNPATWTCAYVSGGPVGAFLQSITPSASQALAGGGTITFTLVFELNQDAGILFKNWSANGVPYQSSTLEVGPCNITDVHFIQWVNGCTGYSVTLNETSLLTITAGGQNPGPVWIYVVNADCAVNKTPINPQGTSPVKKSQVPSINNATAQVGANITLNPGMTSMLDVHTQWQLVKGTNYTKSINWLGISKAVQQGTQTTHNCTLFELVLQVPGQYMFTLMTSASVALVGSTDVNPANDSSSSPSPLTLVVSVGP